MHALRALRLAAIDLWEELLLVVGTAFVGGLLSVLLLPFPFFLAGWYGLALRRVEGNVLSWREWLRAGRQHASFFYRWFLLTAGVSVLLVTNVYFYGRLETEWAAVLSGVAVTLLFVWILPQPFVPALYLRQEDRRLAVTLRNAGVIVLSEPLSLLLLWGVVVALFAVGWFVGWPIWLLIPPIAAFHASRIVSVRIDRQHA